jgi:hypothetical protein
VSPVKPFKNEEDETAFVKALPGDVAPTVYLKRKCYVLRSTKPSQLSTLPKLDPNVPSSPDSVSLSGMQQYLTTVKILTLFLATHTYPAFQTNEDAAQMTSRDMDVHFSQCYVPVENMRGDATYYPRNKRKEVFTTKTAVPEEFTTYPDQESTYSGSGSVIVAKPAPLFPSVNYGPPSAIPSLPGFLFPYFRGIVYPSESGMISIMRRFFLACFGESHENRESKWNTWVKSVSKWHRTDAGMAISHIFFVMQTALEAQGRLFVVVSQGTYLGAAVLGYKFSISLDGMMVRADDHLELLKHAQDLDEHSIALQKIVETLKGLKVGTDEDINMDVEIDVSGPRSLHGEFLKREVPGKEEIQQLAEWVGKLAFTQKYWSISGESTAKAISHITTTVPIPADWPMYLDPLMMFDGSRIFQVMSAFGPLAPSLIDAGGSDVKIPVGLEAEDPESTVPEGQQSIRRPKLFVTGKKLSVACNDMRSVFNKRKIRQNTTERAGGYRTIALAGKQRDMVWTALKMIPGKEEASSKGKKRGAEDEAGDATKKKQRVDETVEVEGIVDF